MRQDLILDSSKPVFLLDPGHGSDTAGKRSPGKKSVEDGRLGILEWEFNRDIVRRIQSFAAARCIQVIDIVPQEKSLPLRERVRIANDINQEYRCFFISIHANAAGRCGWATPRGFRAFVAPKASEDSKRLAQWLRGQIETNIPEWMTRTAVKQSGFFVLRHTDMPAVLTENGFMTSHSDCKILSSEIGRCRIARAHMDAMDYFLSEGKNDN